MNKPTLHIKSYNDLMAEKQRLKAHFNIQKQNLRQEFVGLKDTFNPVSNILKSVGKFTSPDKSMGLINTGLGFGLDLLLRKFILKKSNWLVRFAAPFFIRNILSHITADKIKTAMPEIKPVIDSLAKKAKKD